MNTFVLYKSIVSRISTSFILSALTVFAFFHRTVFIIISKGFFKPRLRSIDDESGYQDTFRADVNKEYTCETIISLSGLGCFNYCRSLGLFIFTVDLGASFSSRGHHDFH